MSDSESDNNMDYEYENISSSDLSDSESEYTENSETSSETDDEDQNALPEHFDFEMPWTCDGIPRPPFPFTGNSGIQEVNNFNNILDIFEFFFDDQLIDLIVTETNRYAIQFIVKNAESMKPHSRVRKWIETNRYEIKTLVGILILQGVCPKPEFKMYFSRRESISTPFYLHYMTEKRFHLLLKFLHFVDNSTIDQIPENRKLAKITPILDILKAKYMAAYLPVRDIAIDESLIGWKGRLSWKQYIPSKRKRFGIKLFALCESISGYIYNFIIYTGKTTTYSEKYSEEPITARIVLSLADSLLGKGYRLFLDNYYTSVNLTDKLVKGRTDCIGTMRINRKGVPTDLKKKLKKGETIARYWKKIMIQKWKDKKDVLMISTIHDETMETVITKTGELQKPSCIVEYNSKMGGVDLADNYLHFYGMCGNRVKKYYMKIFFHFLSVTTLNSYQLYKKNGGRLKRLNFLIELGEKMLEKYARPIAKKPRRSKNAIPSRLIERHFPSLIPPTMKQKPTKR